MISFFIALAVLIVGYIVYGALVEKIFGIRPAENSTPAYTKADGVDYIPMSTWRVFLIQFLNIAGLGPIFGAIMGIMYGPAAFLWIALGTIFGGAVHDYLSGMLSVRYGGASIAEVVGNELGTTIKQVMRVFSVVLLLLLGAVFVYNPAELLALLTEGVADGFMTKEFWIVVVFAYYILATLLPIDKLIGRLYPIFGFVLIFMAVSLFVVLIMGQGAYVQEFTTGLQNRHINPESYPLFPMMFVSIACGAISGFHATQSPLMARCLKNEKNGRVIFYGSMVTEGVVALIWAAATIAFFKGDFNTLNNFLSDKGASVLVHDLSIEWLGTFGGILAILGVVAAPITSGDTALRSARLTVADVFNMSQKTVAKRLLISIPLFALCYLVMNINYQMLWRYFGWSNQTLATFALWSVTMYLARKRKFYFITLLPALFMTSVVVSYILCAPEGFRLDYQVSVITSFVVTALVAIVFFIALKKRRQEPDDEV